MSDSLLAKQRSITEEHLKAVDELIRLEEQNLAAGLSEHQKSRWATLTQRLFGMHSYSERRQFFRVNAQRGAQIRAENQKIEADVTSLSAGGLFLHTDKVSQEMLGRDLVQTAILGCVGIGFKEGGAPGAQGPIEKDLHAPDLKEVPAAVVHDPVPGVVGLQVPFPGILEHGVGPDGESALIH